MSSVNALLRGGTSQRVVNKAPQVRHAVKHIRDITTFETGQTANFGIQHPPQPTELSEDGAHSLRVRQHGNKSIPLPPFMDPVKMATRAKYRSTKIAAVEPVEMTDFQKELAMNPYAHALASPIRQCHLTQARIPKHFLLPFTLRLTFDNATAATSSPSSPSASHPSPPADRQPPTMYLIHKVRPSDGRGYASSYLVNSRAGLSEVNRGFNHEVLFNDRMRTIYTATFRRSLAGTRRKKAKNIVWNRDMPALVEAALRTRVVEELARLCRPGQAEDDADGEGKLAGRKEEGEGKEHEEEVLMRLDGQGASARPHALSCALRTEDDADGQNALLPSTDTRAFDLRALALVEAVQQRLGPGALFGVEKSPRTINLVLALDRLAAYLQVP